MNNLENIEGEFTEIAEIATIAGIDPDLLSDPAEFSKFQEIVNFFSGKEDKRFIINSLVRKIGGQGDVITHVWNYVQLRKEYIDTKQKLEQLQKELRYYE